MNNPFIFSNSSSNSSSNLNENLILDILDRYHELAIMTETNNNQVLTHNNIIILFVCYYIMFLNQEINLLLLFLDELEIGKQIPYEDLLLPIQTDILIQE